MSTKPDVYKVLALFSEMDDKDVLWWRCDKMTLGGKEYDFSPVTFFVNCNDLFYWASADAEKIESEEDIDSLRATYEECKAISEDAVDSAALLWVARKRNMRPQTPYYTYFDKRLYELFDACGPERSKASQG